VDLVLVGLPGSGKSVVGKRVAQRHGATFVDLDELIEREAHRTIPEIFAQEGETAFRAREHAAVGSVGAPTFPSALLTSLPSRVPSRPFTPWSKPTANPPSF